MRADAATHIPENRIIAIIADGRIEPAEEKHLNRCGRCRDDLGSLADDLDRLRQRAEAAAPAPRKRFALPADRPAGPLWLRRPWRWAAIGTGLATALLALMIWVGEKPLSPGLQPTGPAVVEWRDPEMIEINRLAENALPESYLALSASLDGGFDEGFIDFLIPPLEEDSVS